MYTVSPEAGPLTFSRVDVDAYVLGNPGLPADAVRATAEAHNRAIDLMLGEGEFVDAYAAGVAGDPGPTAVAVESLCFHLREKGADPSRGLDAAMVRDRIISLANVAPDHPVAANWRVLWARAYPFSDAPEAWEDVAAVAG